MKTFQKIALVSAIAAAPFTSQALEALDDSVLGNTTGQAGVTIELNIGNSGISIDEIAYTDEGSILLQNLTVKNVNNLTAKIDVDLEGNLTVATTAIDNIQVGLGGTRTGFEAGQFSAVALSGTNGTSELVNNLDLTLDLGVTTVDILNLAGANTLADAAELAGFSTDARNSPVAIRVQSALEITDLDVGIFGNTRAKAEEMADEAGNNDGVLDSAEFADADEFATASAIGIEDVRFYGTGGASGTKATVDAYIWADSRAAADGGGLFVQVGAINGTLEVGAIKLGGESIGSVQISNINLAGLTTRIYGHQ
jgi:hypothetical protein